MSHCVGQDEAVTSSGEVQHTLSDHKANTEEQITGWQEGDDQQHQTKRQSPDNTHTQMSCLVWLRRDNELSRCFTAHLRGNILINDSGLLHILYVVSLELPYK